MIVIQSSDKAENIATLEGLVKAINLDIDEDGNVNLGDYAFLSRYWLELCGEPFWCEGVDLDDSGQVDSDDMTIFMEKWLE